MENIERTFQDILLAEKKANDLIEKAQTNALEILKKAKLKDDGLREKTLQKLKEENEKLNEVFLQEKAKVLSEGQKNAKAQIGKLQKKASSKMEELANKIVLEVLSVWQ